MHDVPTIAELNPAIHDWDNRVAGVTSVTPDHDATGPAIPLTDPPTCTTCGMPVHVYSPNFDTAELRHGDMSAKAVAAFIGTSSETGRSARGGCLTCFIRGDHPDVRTAHAHGCVR